MKRDDIKGTPFGLSQPSGASFHAIAGRSSFVMITLCAFRRTASLSCQGGRVESWWILIGFSFLPLRIEADAGCVGL